MNPQLRTLCLLSLALALVGCSDTIVRDCRLYTQDNRIVHYYSSYSYSQKYAGSGKFMITTRLPDESLAAVEFAETNTGESGHESNSR